jgi:phosphatidate phosphatase APP1
MFDDFDDNEVAIVERVRDEKTEKMIEYIRNLNTIEEAMEPYKEQKRELRKEYKEQEWLSKEEISMAVKAYRMMKSEVDVEQLVKVYDSIRGGNR